MHFAAKISQEAGAFVVTVRDLPEVVTTGDDLKEALSLAADAIEVAIAGRMEDDMELPAPTPPLEGELLVALPPAPSAKAAVYGAWKATGITKSELARRLGRTETEARRILNPRHNTKIEHLDEAARALGKRLFVGIEAA
jgi:antitoxin HicB